MLAGQQTHRKPLTASLFADISIGSQEVLLLGEFVGFAAETVSPRSYVRRQGHYVLSDLAALASAGLGHPRTEREGGYRGEMWRRVRRSALGSGVDLRAAYTAHGAELYRFALRSLKDRGLAEEAVQDTFVRAWRAADRHDPKLGSLRTWLFAICKNATIDLHRARSIRPAMMGQEDTARGESADPANPIEERLVAWQIEEALMRVSEEHRHAIVETYYKGRSYKELATELGVPSGTLRSRVFYGMKALRRELEEMGWTP